jgi:site-specific DNA-methyltransferase (adenine-specific)
MWHQQWAEEALRVLKPGGHLLAFSATRTYHRMACAIEDAGFEIRDSIHWVYGSGFPKSLNVGKQDGCEEWEGWGTALKPAHEPIVVARKPLQGTVAGNVLVWGTGGLNVDGCRVPHQSEADRASATPQGRVTSNRAAGAAPDVDSKGRVEVERADTSGGRWPANVVFDRTAGEALDQQSGERPAGTFPSERGASVATSFASGRQPGDQPAHRLTDKGGASRFFTQADFGPDDWPFVYQAKPSRKERNAGLDGLPEQRPDQRTTTGMGTFEEKGVAKQSNHHPTVKPVALMRHLVRLVTPPGGTVLDPFAGSGTTLVAAILERMVPLGCEMTDEYLPIIEGRMAWAHEQVAAAQDAETNPAQPTLL